MYELIIPGAELWDSEKEEFIYRDKTRLIIEHSLVSISRWESIWHKPYLDHTRKEPLSREETLDYIRCMILAPEKVDDEVLKNLSRQNIDDIEKYIDAPMTATWFSSDGRTKKSTNNSKIVTSELIYYWMITFHIPVEFEHWHLNRLLTLIRVCEEESQPPRKMSPKEIAERNRRLNAERRKKFNSKG